MWCAVTARGVSEAGPSPSGSSELGMAGVKPAAAIDSLADTPRTPRDSAASAAPVVATGNVQATPQARRHTRQGGECCQRRQTDCAAAGDAKQQRSTSEHATAVASNALAVDGPPGTARKPAAAANTTAMTLSVTQRIGSGWARRTATAPIAAADAMAAPVIDVTCRVGDNAGPHQRRRSEHGRAQARRGRR